jgi:hypothetical protein
MIKQIAKLLRYESTAYTQNDHDLSDAKEQYLVKYKAVHASQQPQKPAQIPIFTFEQPVSVQCHMTRLFV